MFSSIAYASDFQTWKNANKRKTHWTSKSETSKLKKTGSKINGEKKESRKGKNMGKKWTCPFDVFCIYFAFLICFFLNFYFAFVLPFSRQKAKYMQKNKLRKQLQKTSNGQVILFFPFWLFSMFFPFYFAFVFFGFCWFGFCFFRFFFCICLGFFQVCWFLE